MIALEVQFQDGTWTHAQGAVAWIEDTITQIAETGKQITSYTITDIGA